MIDTQHDIATVAPISTPEGRTDLANSRRLVASYGDTLRYCHARRKWLIWQGTRWAWDDSGAADRLGKAVADALWDEARTVDQRDALNWAARTASGSGIRAMLTLAESDLPIGANELDGNGWLLNCPNGTIDLRSGECREHRREDYITRLCPVEFDPLAQSPTWARFLAEVFAGDDALVCFMQRLLGYGVTGNVSEQVLPIFWGSGANGKSTLLDAVAGCLGKDYCDTLPRTLLMASGGERHPTELTTLHGKRLMLAHETDCGGRLSEALVKQLTGGDAITARGMREDFWTFSPTHKIILCTNHKPRVRGTDHAIWRRLRLVPFTERFDGDRRDKAMPERLRAELPGILSWLVRGCQAWQREGLNEADAVTTATAEYRDGEDALAGFIADDCLTGASYRAKAGQLYAAYQAWCERCGERALNQRKFGAGMTERGFERQKNNDWWYVGIGLRTE